MVDLIGFTVEDAQARLFEDGYELETELRDSARRRGTVVDQFPRKGGTPGNDGVVRVYVSDGLLLPSNIIGMRGVDASTKLQNLGATVQTTIRNVGCGLGGLVADIAGFRPGDRFDASLDTITLVINEKENVYRCSEHFVIKFRSMGAAA